ncbi:hypothetical protein PtA15_18A4 [Puccinia triticina]|uniref:Uncharacterized protein n=1 Tax=Puccinia triticina TaxID=208348 RepID=A0ABY7D855_9BASI|nr:uncharacterized protein PtA15_18A4 [Puccinia triticina]WAQ92949.1 hypothetical protein PtA15_18A4 [Puccinia triticina]
MSTTLPDAQQTLLIAVSANCEWREFGPELTNSLNSTKRDHLIACVSAAHFARLLKSIALRRPSGSAPPSNH